MLVYQLCNDPSRTQHDLDFFEGHQSCGVPWDGARHPRYVTEVVNPCLEDVHCAWALLRFCCQSVLLCMSVFLLILSVFWHVFDWSRSSKLMPEFDSELEPPTNTSGPRDLRFFGWQMLITLGYIFFTALAWYGCVQLHHSNYPMIAGHISWIVGWICAYAAAWAWLTQVTSFQRIALLLSVSAVRRKPWGRPALNIAFSNSEGKKPSCRMQTAKFCILLSFCFQFVSWKPRGVRHPPLRLRLRASGHCDIGTASMGAYLGGQVPAGLSFSGPSFVWFSDVQTTWG